jgi:hypothetical protein
MAVQGEENYTHGSMDISGHRKTWAGFATFVKLSILGLIIVVGLLAIFRT